MVSRLRRLLIYRLLFVDDEQMTRYGLTQLFDWSKLNVEVVGEADDGTTALPPFGKAAPGHSFHGRKNGPYGRYKAGRAGQGKIPGSENRVSQRVQRSGLRPFRAERDFGAYTMKSNDSHT